MSLGNHISLSSPNIQSSLHPPSSPHMELHLLPPSPSPATTTTSTTPYATAPSSPQSTIPFTWEHTPGISKHHHTSDDSDFAFIYLERHSISAADDLFDSGKIKPLKPPPCLQLHPNNDSPRSPKSPKSRFKESISLSLSLPLSLSPKSKKKDFDPFSEALKQTSCGQSETHEDALFRGSDEATNGRNNGKDRSSPVGLNWYSKWNLKNLLLFRSASEGSVITRKELSKRSYRKKNQSLSFRSSDGGAGGATVDDGGGLEEVRKKSDLQCRSGLMGCLRFHQNGGGGVREISRGFDSVLKR